MNEYNAAGKLVHEDRANDGERLDAYLARILPDFGDGAFWFAECDADRVQVRDHFPYDRARWFIRWWDGEAWQSFDLPEGERPRLRHGFCHIVKEDAP